MTFPKMRAFALKVCQGIYIFQFTNNVWLQYPSQAYQMNCDWSKRAKTGEYPRLVSPNEWSNANPAF